MAFSPVVRVLFFILDEVFSVNTTCFAKTMVNASIVVTPLFPMTFLFSKTFLGSLFNGADAFDSESLAVRNTFGAMFRTGHSVGGSLTARWSQASQHASIPSLCGMLVYNDVTSIETRIVPEGRFEDNQWCLSKVRVTLIHEVEGGNRRIWRFFLWGTHLLKQWVSQCSNNRKCSCQYDFFHSF